jgi:hypothetical protein
LSTTRFTGTTIFMFLVSSSGHICPGIRARNWCGAP